MYIDTTHGWAVHPIFTVTKQPVLVQVPEAVTSVGVKKKSSEYMLVGEKMEK